MVGRPSRAAMLQTARSFLPVAPPKALGLTVAELQNLRSIQQSQRPAGHLPEHFHASQLLGAHGCPLHRTLLRRLQFRGHFYRGQKGTLSKRFNSIIIVLVFRELTSFVRKILQREENKGVELTGAVQTVCGGRLRSGKMFNEGHRFGRMEGRRARKGNVNYPSVAHPPTALADAWPLLLRFGFRPRTKSRPRHPPSQEK